MLNNKVVKETKMKIKKGDNVKVIAGKSKGKEGKILFVDRKKNRIIVEGVNIISKHQKPNKDHQAGGIIQKEAAIAASNVMFIHKGKPTRLGFKLEVIEKDGKKIVKKQRIAKSTGEVVD
jgi:large subunit ribosomal protein L24